jgi:DNA topoisomerase-2
MIFTDADNDGSHIKGLIINFIHSFWPSLLDIDSFISCIVTPIVKITKGPKTISFYNQAEFVEWKNKNESGKWNVKYYKGLGTSTAKEAKEYFTNLAKQTVIYNMNETSNDDLIKAFKKGFEDNRKEWIKESTGKVVQLNFGTLKQTISAFVNQELVNFSIADLERSIPNIMDGFKPSQRKVLYGCIKKGLYTDMKVAQLSGYISEHTSYHHGEVSLQGTIINMAQDYTGSNNINLLVPSGQFGTRLQGGKDSGSPRYIFTCLQPITKILFNEHDSKLLDYLDDDGMQIEPKYYIPIIPMLLVNGAEGIGTGYSTSIPCYNPDDIIANLKKLIDSNGSADLLPMVPWYRGFKGTIELEAENKYISTGVWNRMNQTTIEITELPIGKWTQNYKEFLETLVEANEIIDYKNNCDDTTVNFKVIMQKIVIDQLISSGEMVKKLKLTTSISTSNMHVFDADCKIRKMSCPEEIIFHFYKIRKDHFAKRKKYLLETYESDYLLLEAKIRFINLVVAEKIEIFNKKKDFIVKQIIENKLLMVNGNYDYLLDLKINTFTLEKITELTKKVESLKAQIEKLRVTSISTLWNTELLSLEF